MNCPLCNNMPIRARRVRITRGGRKGRAEYGDPIPVARVPIEDGKVMLVYLCSHCGNVYGEVRGAGAPKQD